MLSAITGLASGDEDKACLIPCLALSAPPLVMYEKVPSGVTVRPPVFSNPKRRPTLPEVKDLFSSLE